MQSETQWTVTIEEHGRWGRIHYREGENAALFYWEFGGGRVVVFIQPDGPAGSGGTPEDKIRRWDETYPWARGRRIEIMEKIGRDVCRQRAPTCSFKINAAESLIEILEPSNQ